MNPDLATVLLLIACLQVKHFICDGPLQTLRMVQDKSVYGKPYGLLHAAVHLAGTLAVLLVFGLPFQTVALLAAMDGVIHYHLDFFKNNFVKARGWTIQDGPYWWAFTADQVLHHMTYLLLAWLAFKP
jgi:hypothetical protein